MLMKVFIEFVERDVRRGLRNHTSLNNNVKYIADVECDRTHAELSVLLKEAHDKIEKDPQLLITEETAKPFLDFLSNRWQRLRLMSPASFLVNPHSSANIYCMGIASWLSDALGCEPLELLIPTLDKRGRPYPSEPCKYVLDDAERGFIDVLKCLTSASYDNPQLKQTRLIDGELLPLSANEQARVIHFSEQTRALYREMTSGNKNKLFSAERNLRNAMRSFSANHSGYSNEGKKRLIAHIFKSQEAVIDLLHQHDKDEWQAIISNFELEDLSLAVLQVDPIEQRFKSTIQGALQHGKPCEELLFVIHYLYDAWMDTEENDYRLYLEEWDISTMSALSNQDYKKQNRWAIISTASEDLLDSGSLVFTPLMRDFYNNLNSGIRPELEIICAIKNYVTSFEELVLSFQVITTKDSVWREFVSLFSYNELTVMMFGEVPSSKYRFIDMFTNSLNDDSNYKADPGHNKAVLYCFNYLYEIWRLTQDKCTTKLPFFRLDLGYEMAYKIEASQFIGKFLASKKTLNDYDHFLDEYVSMLKCNNEKKDETALTKIDPDQFRDSLTTGTVWRIVDRLKKVINEEFQPKIRSHNRSFSKVG